VPRSILLGRPWPQPGEEFFTTEDTDYAIALAEEERDTCGQCGLLKVWCRDPKHQFSFEPHEETCWPTYRLAQYQESDKWKAKLDDTKRATQLSVRFRDGHEPDYEAGLDLPDQRGDADERADDR